MAIMSMEGTGIVARCEKTARSDALDASVGGSATDAAVQTSTFFKAGHASDEVCARHGG